MLPHKSYFGIVLIAVIGTGLVLMTAQMMCPDPSINASRQGWRTCIAFTLFKEMQTLVAAAIALLAAIIAVRPVYLQLDKMKVQTDIASRDVIDRRLRKIIDITASDYKCVRDIHNDMGRGMDHEMTEFDRPFNVHWAHDLSGTLSGAVSSLRVSQNERLGTARVELARANLIHATSSLRDCVGDIAAPATADHYEDISDAQMATIIDQAKIAEDELYNAWLEVNGALNRFQIVCETEQDLIRKRVRAIDDLIVDANI